MDNFKVIFKILSILESSLDCDGVNLDRLTPENLGISKNRRNALLKMLNDRGFIVGVVVKKYTDGDMILIIDDIMITLDGLEYLSENTLMKKAYNMAKGIADLIP